MKSRKPLIGILNLARATFDIPFAESKAEQAWQSLQSIEADIVGTKKLLYDGQALENAVAAFENPKPDLLLIVQATFTDAAATVEFVRRLGIPVVIWSFPEPREGGRLRLNSFCGLNLAAHALGKAEIDFEYLHLPPDSREAVDRISILARAAMAKRRIAESRLLVIGRHPDGFDTCQYDAADLKEWCGATVENMDLSAFLQAVPTIPDQKMMVVRQKLDTQVSNLAEMEEEPLKLSLKVFLALKDTALAKGYDGLAVRCWPEFFTELGCAACGAMSMMNEAGIPCACEADLYGVLTSLLLQSLSDTPVFLSDLVDIETEDNTGVFWHCGLAPLSMADPDKEVRAQIHTNRRKPFLYEFTLKPGRITFVRLSQSENRRKIVVGTGEVIAAPMSFTGTSGVVRFDSPATDVMDAVIGKKLEHHFSLVYGDYRSELAAIAKMMKLPIEFV